MPRHLSLKVIQRRIRELELKAMRLRTNPALPKIVRLMRKNRVSIGELRKAMNGRTGAANRGPHPLKGSKAKPMYRNPETRETWSGRGRAARWLAAAEKAGHDRKEFLIKKPKG